MKTPYFADSNHPVKFSTLCRGAIQKHFLHILPSAKGNGNIKINVSNDNFSQKQWLILLISISVISYLKLFVNICISLYIFVMYLLIRSVSKSLVYSIPPHSDCASAPAVRWLSADTTWLTCQKTNEGKATFSIIDLSFYVAREDSGPSWTCSWLKVWLRVLILKVITVCLLAAAKANVSVG